MGPYKKIPLFYMYTLNSKTKTIIICAFTASLSFNTAFAGEDRGLYLKAVQSAKSGNTEFAFMNFHMFLNAYPESKIAPEALFAMGEYYFASLNYLDAANAFSRILIRYPEAKVRIFALAYLLEIAKKQKNENLVKNIETEIVSSRQIVFLFREFKEYKYRSPLSKNYKAVHFIDKVEFYINNEFFTKVSY